MNATRVYICGIISLLWFVNEILSVKVYENITGDEKPPFTIDTAKKISVPTATGATEITTLYLSAQATQKPTDDEQKSHEQRSNEQHVKAQMYVADNLKIQSQNAMALKNVQVRENQRTNTERTDRYTSVEIEKKEDKNQKNNNQQKWQIPSPISPLATTDPKAINSSKRQIENHGGSYSLNTFVPSQELGPFEDNSGFVPHAYHQPKVINYVSPTYIPAKPAKHDVNINYGNFGEQRLPIRTENGLQSFENDFEDLKTKYPELNDLVNNYPIMEEIMKQKLAEKFKQSGNLQPHYKTTSNSFEDNSSSAEKYNKFTSAENTQITPVDVKFSPNSNEEASKIQNNNGYQQFQQFGKVHPYAFDQRKPDWSTSFKKPDRDIFTTAETPPTLIPAGGFYQEPKFPISPWINNDDDKKYGSGEQKPPPVLERPKKMISPWKRIIHMITAFLPVGILISALTPNVVTISNVPDKNYPIRQRSLNDPEENPLKLTTHLLELIKSTDSKVSREDAACDDWQFCEVIRKGKNSDPSTIENVYWKIAQDTPEHVAEKSGLKKLFKAAKAGDCGEFTCKRNQKRSSRRTYPVKDFVDPYHRHEITEHRHITKVINDQKNRTEESLPRSEVLSRGKRARSVRII